MPTWKPHPLAGEARPRLELRVGQKVVSTAELRGVPAGTRGVVFVADGFVWLRYTVRFENGVVLGSLDGRHIEPAGKRAAPRR